MITMNENQIKSKLDELADLQAAGDALKLQKQALIDTILTDEIKAKLAEIEYEFERKQKEGYDKAIALDAEIKAAVLANGASVKGIFLHAIWMKGRVSWDTKGLDGYAVAHPEMAAFRKEGEPTCSIRGVK